MTGAVNGAMLKTYLCDLDDREYLEVGIGGKKGSAYIQTTNSAGEETGIVLSSENAAELALLLLELSKKQGFSPERGLSDQGMAF